MQGFYQALQHWWAAYLWQDLEKAFPADQIERLSEVDEGDVQGHLLFSILLELADGEDHVYC